MFDLFFHKILSHDGVAKPAEASEGAEEGEVGIGRAYFIEIGHEICQHFWLFEIKQLIVSMF